MIEEGSESIKVLVLGGAGFIGSRVVRRFHELKHDIRVVDNLSTIGDWRNVGNLQGVGFVKADFTKPGVLKREVGWADVVIHSAVACLPEGLQHPFRMLATNDAGTFHVAEVCTIYKKPLVYISSCEVYGYQTSFPIPETAPLNPTTPYGASKACGEMWCKSFGNAYGLKYVILRLFNGLGPGIRTDRYAPSFIRFIESVRKNEPPLVFGDGSQTRDFTDVDDLAEGVYRGTMRLLEGPLHIGQVYNIARGEEVSILDLAKEVIAIYGKNLKPAHFQPGRPGDIQRLLADTRKAQEALSFTAKKSWKESLREVEKWYEQNHPTR